MRRSMTPEDFRMFFPLFFFIIWPAVLRLQYFRKAGEKPIKALIPFYGTYKFYDLFFHRYFFWVYLLLWIAKAVTAVFLENAVFYSALSNTLDALIYLCTVFPFATGAWCLRESVLFSVFTFFLYPILAAIVAFQKDPEKGTENTSE